MKFFKQFLFTYVVQLEAHVARRQFDKIIKAAVISRNTISKEY